MRFAFVFLSFLKLIMKNVIMLTEGRGELLDRERNYRRY